MGNPITAMEKLAEAIEAGANAATAAAKSGPGSGTATTFSPDAVEGYAGAAKQLAEAYEKLKG
jgi:hypothetical protein